MGMICNLAMIPTVLAEQLLDDEARTSRKGLFVRRRASTSDVSFHTITEGIPGEDQVDIDKTWQAIHWLLNGDEFAVTAPGGGAVMGGVTIGRSVDTRLLPSDEVGQVAAALAGVSATQLGERADLAQMEAAELYPQIWDEDDVFDSYIAPHYEVLREFYSRAAAAGVAVAITIG